MLSSHELSRYPHEIACLSTLDHSFCMTATSLPSPGTYSLFPRLLSQLDADPGAHGDPDRLPVLIVIVIVIQLAFWSQCGIA